uniref:AvrM-B n=1 Tax=Melampsora lini TaxID=5261 RepID=Q2MV51_MELLI|nr:AvrM-B [Melampsora lini]
MMMISTKSKLRNIFLLLAIANVNFCVKGHPMNSAKLAEEVKDGLNAAHGDSLSNNLGTVPDVPHQIPNDKSGTPAIEDPKDMKGFNKALKSTPESEKLGTSSVEGIPQPEFDRGFLRPFGAKMKFLKPDQVQKLSTDDLITYMAEKDKNVRDLAIKLRDAKQDSTKNGTPEIKQTYDKAYEKTKAAAEKLVSEESLTRDALLKLTEEQYVEKAALFDKDVYRNNLKRQTYEKLLRSETDVLYREVARIFIAREGEPALNAKIERLALTLENNADTRSKPIDYLAIAADFLKNQANLHADDPELNLYKAEIKAREIKANRAMKEALKGADKLFKRNKILKSPDMRYKSAGFQAFIDKMMAWLSKIMPTKSYIKSLAKP